MNMLFACSNETLLAVKNTFRVMQTSKDFVVDNPASYINFLVPVDGRVDFMKRSFYNMNVFDFANMPEPYLIIVPFTPISKNLSCPIVLEFVAGSTVHLSIMFWKRRNCL